MREYTVTWMSWRWLGAAQGLVLAAGLTYASETSFVEEEGQRNSDDFIAELDMLSELDISTDTQKIVHLAKLAAIEGDWKKALQVSMQLRSRVVTQHRSSLQLSSRLAELHRRHLINDSDYKQIGQISTRAIDGLNDAAHTAENSDVNLSGVLAVNAYLEQQELAAHNPTNKSLQQNAETLLALIKTWDRGRQTGRVPATFMPTLRNVMQQLNSTKSEIKNMQLKEHYAQRRLQILAAIQAGAWPQDWAKVDFDDLNSDLSQFRWEKALPNDLANNDIKEGELYAYLQIRTIAMCAAAQDYELAQSILLKADEYIRHPDQSARRQIYQTLKQKLAELSPLETEIAVHVTPQAHILKLDAQLDVLTDTVRLAKSRYLSDASFWQRMQRWERQRTLTALDQTVTALHRLKRRLRSANSLKQVATFARSAETVTLLTLYTAEAALHHYRVTQDYAAILERISTNFYEGSSTLIGQDDYSRIRLLLSRERSEGVFRAYVNRDTITTAAFSALLLGEAVGMVFSAGATGAAVPATYSAVQVALSTAKAATTVGRLVLAADAGSRMFDRGYRDGLSGLASIETAFDAMILLSVLPRIPLPAVAEAGARSWSQTILYKLQRSAAHFQYSSLKQLATGTALYSGYQLVRADAIAEELAKDGVHVDASSIRRRAAINLLMSGLVYLDNQRFQQRERVRNPTGLADLQKSMSLRESFLYRRIQGAINPVRAAINFYKVRPSLLRAFTGTGVGLAYAGYDYIFLNEAIMLSYTNPDFNYMREIQQRNPFPELRDNESALALVGLDPLDAFLYMGAHAQGSHRPELALYGDKFGIEDFNSPEDLLEQLKAYARQNGPIRYLKIMTHGKPGQLYTRAIDAGDHAVLGRAGQGWINAEWLRAFRAKIRQVGAETFAPDARIVLWACLVGSNLDWVDNEGETLSIGDEFMDEFAASFLVHGGSIDASNRILVGIDAMFGNAWRHAVNVDYRAEENRRHRLIPLLDLSGDEEQDSLDPYGTEQSFGKVWRVDQNDVLERDEPIAGHGLVARSAYLGQRIQTMVVRMPEVWYRYGIQLEGPWWQDRYKYRTYPAQ